MNLPNVHKLNADQRKALAAVADHLARNGPTTMPELIAALDSHRRDDIDKVVKAGSNAGLFLFLRHLGNMPAFAAISEIAVDWMVDHPDKYAEITGGATPPEVADPELLELAEANRLRAVQGHEPQTLEGMRAFKKENR